MANAPGRDWITILRVNVRGSWLSTATRSSITSCHHRAGCKAERQSAQQRRTSSNSIMPSLSSKPKLRMLSKLPLSPPSKTACCFTVSPQGVRYLAARPCPASHRHTCTHAHLHTGIWHDFCSRKEKSCVRLLTSPKSLSPSSPEIGHIAERPMR